MAKKETKGAIGFEAKLWAATELSMLLPYVRAPEKVIQMTLEDGVFGRPLEVWRIA